MARKHCIDRVCGYLRTLIALEGLSEWEACLRIGIPLRLLDIAEFREALKPRDFETVK